MAERQVKNSSLEAPQSTKIIWVMLLLAVFLISCMGFSSGVDYASCSIYGTCSPVLSSSLTAFCSATFVPYNNAFTDINLNQQNVTNLHLIQFANLTNLPTCNVAARGIFGYSQGVLGAADQLLICKKNNLDIYIWTPI